ncbi:MAG: V-type ATP synthase subunit D, partial [Fibrobacter sp.]|nr:V-type ATP synthase subunit D [Fibrobacter sp.]
AKESVVTLGQELKKQYEKQKCTYRFWGELPDGLITVSDVNISIKKIAGVKTPVLNNVEFVVNRYSTFSQQPWIPQGVEILKELATLKISMELAKKKVEVLEFARKKTTQKVNLYEKVQIPEYKEAIRKIKRFLEDEENLSKSSQKILKSKLAEVEA